MISDENTPDRSRPKPAATGAARPGPGIPTPTTDAVNKEQNSREVAWGIFRKHIESILKNKGFILGLAKIYDGKAGKAKCEINRNCVRKNGSNVKVNYLVQVEYEQPLSGAPLDDASKTITKEEAWTIFSQHMDDILKNKQFTHELVKIYSGKEATASCEPVCNLKPRSQVEVHYLIKVNPKQVSMNASPVDTPKALDASESVDEDEDEDAKALVEEEKSEPESVDDPAPANLQPSGVFSRVGPYIAFTVIVVMLAMILVFLKQNFHPPVDPRDDLLEIQSALHRQSMLIEKQQAPTVKFSPESEKVLLERFRPISFAEGVDVWVVATHSSAKGGEDSKRPDRLYCNHYRDTFSQALTAFERGEKADRRVGLAVARGAELTPMVTPDSPRVVVPAFPRSPDSVERPDQFGGLIVNLFEGIKPPRPHHRMILVTGPECPYPDAKLAGWDQLGDLQVVIIVGEKEKLNEERLLGWHTMISERSSTAGRTGGLTVIGPRPPDAQHQQLFEALVRLIQAPAVRVLARPAIPENQR